MELTLAIILIAVGTVVGVAIGVFYVVLPLCGVINIIYTILNIIGIIKGEISTDPVDEAAEEVAKAEKEV